MCYSPVTIKTSDGYKQVPCGKCLECLVKYQQDWSNRMYEELKAHDGKAVFFTLTYDEQNVPKNYLKIYGKDNDNQVVYDLLRSPSDYGYSNVYTDEKGREKVLQSYGRERKKRAVAPTVVLEEAGLDPHDILDFNLKRENHAEFIEKVKRQYGEFVSITHVDSADMPSSSDFSGSSSSDVFDFDAYEGDYFSGSLADSQFREVIDDDDYLETSPAIVATSDSPVMQFNSVRKKDVQDWLKRGRERLKRDGHNFTYFITSEYGPRTLRPHYHGVLFGVTAQEAVAMRNDWCKHHGQRIDWQNVDLSKGDGSYCAKYCSKGFFEHPLCSRDFFYSRALKTDDGVEILPFSEYHSKHYERCMELFGIDAPIVDRSFKLVSKGFGLKWCTDRTADLVDEFYDETEDIVQVHREVAPWDDDYTTFIDKGYKPDEFGFIQTDYEEKKINKKTLNYEKYERSISRLFDRFKYYRTYKQETVAYGVPKYYREKVFDNVLRLTFANYVQSFNAEVYREKLRSLCAGKSTGEDPQAVLAIAQEEREQHIARARKYYKKLEKNFNKSKL